MCCLCCAFVINSLWVIWCHQYSTQGHLDSLRKFVNFQSPMHKEYVWSSLLPVSVILKASEFEISFEFFHILIPKMCNAMVLIEIHMPLRLLGHVHSFTRKVHWTQCIESLCFPITVIYVLYYIFILHLEFIVIILFVNQLVYAVHRVLQSCTSPKCLKLCNMACNVCGSSMGFSCHPSDT